MKNYKDSDYAVNKYNQGIVYKFANEIKVITLEMFLAENPSHTKVEFEQLKAASDEIYKQIDRCDNAQTAKNFSLSTVEEAKYAIKSPEQIMIDQIVKDDCRKNAKEKTEMILSCLTPVQRQRYLLYKYRGLTTRQIADIEGVSQRTVMDSLEYAQKKIIKILSKIKKTPLKTPSENALGEKINSLDEE